MPEKCNVTEGFARICGQINLLSRPTLLVIAGGSCSGKSYLARKLKTTFPDSTLVPLDSFFKSVDDPTLPLNEDKKKIFDRPDSYHIVDFRLAVESLFYGQCAYLPKYNLLQGKVIGGVEKLKASDIVIAEGLFSITMLESLINKANAYIVYMETDYETALNRRIERDTELLGVTKEKVKNIFDTKVMPNHLQFVIPQKNKANLIITN